MSVVDFTRLLAVVLGILGVLSSAITWVPAPGHLELVLPVGLLAAAGVVAVGGWRLGRFPSIHWVHHTGPMWLALGAVAAVVTVLALTG